MDYEALLSMVRARRSCRRFEAKPLPDEYVRMILEAARWAPSGANSQPWDFIVIKEENRRQEIVQFIKKFLSLYYKLEHTRDPDLRFPSITEPASRIGYEDAPVFIIPCGDTRTKAAYPLYTAVEIADAILESSLANAFLYMQLAASALGLGSQWVSVARMWYVQCRIRDLLGIPEDYVVYDMFVVGYPASTPKPRMVRPLEEMIHEDHFDQAKMKTDEEVRAFIAALRKGRTYSEMGSKRKKDPSPIFKEPK